MIATIQKWGNSQGLRVPKTILESAGLAVGSEVEIVAGKGELVLRATNRRRGKYRLEDLLARMPETGVEPGEVWNDQSGTEIW